MTSRLSKSHQKAIEEGKLVETSNALDIDTFSAQLCDTTTVSEAEKKCKEKTGTCIEISLLSADAFKRGCKDVLEACFDLIEESSADDYKASEIKWSAASKRKEMLLPDMKYLVVHQRSASNERTASGTNICAFVSFMVTYEDGYEVVYVYEIHLERHLRGQGVGTVLMQLVEGVGRNAGVEKCMLTVFKANQKALKWYEHCGYQIDDFSPGPRVLRNGTIKEPTYLILSKSLKTVLEPQSGAAAQRAS